ncbi:MAG: adenosylcobinamide-GDP ribazoletransferase [Phocaeicola sp.]
MKNLAAALIFFTRLPFWRLRMFQVPSECFKQAISYWAVVGWLTAGIMAATLWLSAQLLPYSVAVILALISRLLLTGALHEDGLADFFDGFGGGTTRERTLAIMKDSHIGTYGVVGLILYFLLMHALVNSMSLTLACSVILVADPFCKLVASRITAFLPYARTEESSKAKTVYVAATPFSLVLSTLCGLLPFALLPITLWAALLFPLSLFLYLISFMRKRIEGYTGDCCGALFLLCELSFYLGVSLLYNVVA